MTESRVGQGGGTRSAGVLVVDDERFFREAIVEILGEAGLRCAVAEGGRQAIDLAQDPSVGVVVLDIRMPDIDGIQVLAQLREIRPSLRVIMLSASTDQELVLEALRLGACDYLAKPLHDEELVLAVRRALESYSVETDWHRLRGRLDRLVARMEELVGKADAAAPEERIDIIRGGAALTASEVLEAGKTSLMLLDEQEEVLTVVASVGREIAPDDMDPVPAGAGVAGMALRRSEPLVVSNVAQDPLFADRATDGRYQSGSFAVAPLRVGSRPIGVLCVTDRAGGDDFSSDDLALLRLLAMQIAELLTLPDPGLPRAGEEVADESALAHSAEVLPKSDEEESLERDAELARLVCQAVIDEVEPARVLHAALRPLTHWLPAAPVSLFLIDPASGELVREAECDGGLCPDRESLRKGCGLTGSVLQTGSMVASQDPAADPRFDPEVDTPEGGEVRPLLCLPLQLRGKVVGVFRAFLQDGGVASARTGEVLAAALSAAVRNALLYRSLVDSIEEVAEARREARR